MPTSIQELIRRTQAERYALVNLEQNPAAGAEHLFTVPGDYMLRLLAVRLQLTTDITVANRAPSILLDDGNSVFYEHETPVTQGASETRSYTWAAGLGYASAGIIENAIVIGIPELVLLPGWRIRTATAGLVPGDDYAASAALVERIPARGQAAEIAYELGQQLAELAAIDTAAAAWATPGP